MCVQRTEGHPRTHAAAAAHPITVSDPTSYVSSAHAEACGSRAHDSGSGTQHNGFISNRLGSTPSPEILEHKISRCKP